MSHLKLYRNHRYLPKIKTERGLFNILTLQLSNIKELFPTFTFFSTLVYLYLTFGVYVHIKADMFLKLTTNQHTSILLSGYNKFPEAKWFNWEQIR